MQELEQTLRQMLAQIDVETTRRANALIRADVPENVAWVKARLEYEAERQGVVKELAKLEMLKLPEPIVVS